MKIENDEWCFDDEVLRWHVVGLLRELYTSDYIVNGVFLCRGRFPPISPIKVDTLIMVTSNKVVWKVVFSMTPSKTPSTDWFQAKFFQLHWDVIGALICSLVQ